MVQFDLINEWKENEDVDDGYTSGTLFGILFQSDSGEIFTVAFVVLGYGIGISFE